MDNSEVLIAALLQAHHGAAVELVTVQTRAGGPQGYSGAALRYYDVAYMLGGNAERMTIVTKKASLVERHTLAWLNEHGLAVPFSYTADLTTDESVSVCMEYAGDPAPVQGSVQEVARSLAAIHHAALGHGDNLAWLPRADPQFFATRLLDSGWRGPWHRVLTGAGYTNWYGQFQPAVEPDATFGETFGAIYPLLEERAKRFVNEMAALWAAGDSLTLVHCDFHGSNVRWQAGRPRLLDWEQAQYGSLYIDLPNFFSREEALLYRNALADLGHDIPRDKFLAGYDAARPYPGFKYFGIGLWNWRHGDPAQRQANVQYWIDMVLGTGQ